MALEEPGPGLVIAGGGGWLAQVWCVVKGLVELGSLDLQPLWEGCCWTLARPYRCPPFTEMTCFIINGGFAILPLAAKPMQGADGAHLERAISAKAKPISELITSVLCESWGFPGDCGDEAALRSPSAAAGAARAGGAGGPGWPPRELSCSPWGQLACKNTRWTDSELCRYYRGRTHPFPCGFPGCVS